MGLEGAKNIAEWAKNLTGYELMHVSVFLLVCCEDHMVMSTLQTSQLLLQFLMKVHLWKERRGRVWEGREGREREREEEREGEEGGVEGCSCILYAVTAAGSILGVLGHRFRTGLGTVRELDWELRAVGVSRQSQVCHLLLHLLVFPQREGIL